MYKTRRSIKLIGHSKINTKNRNFVRNCVNYVTVTIYKYIREEKKNITIEKEKQRETSRHKPSEKEEKNSKFSKA